MPDTRSQQEVIQNRKRSGPADPTHTLPRAYDVCTCKVYTYTLSDPQCIGRMKEVTEWIGAEKAVNTYAHIKHHDAPMVCLLVPATKHSCLVHALVLEDVRIREYACASTPIKVSNS